MVTGIGTATALRRRARAGLTRLDGARWSVLQCAIAGALGWEVAVALLDHPAPIFAAVAAVVCLGASQEQRLRRIVELGIGVTVGVGLGDLIVRVIGRGAWQIGLVVAFAMAVALILDGANLLVNQAALQAVFVTAVPLPAGGTIVRWLDALTGAAAALLVAVVLPVDPRRPVREKANAHLSALADILADTARAIRERRPEVATAALARARATQPALDSWRRAVQAGEEISSVSPMRRGGRHELAAYRQAVVGVDRATRNLRVVIRRVDSQLRQGGPIPSEIADALDDLATILREMRGALRPLGGPARHGLSEVLVHRLTTVGARLSPGAMHADSLPTQVMVGQLRSAVVDLFQAQGITFDDARRHLPS